MLLAKRIIEINALDDHVELCTDGAKLFMFFINENIIRVATSFDEEYRELSYNLVTTAWEDDGDAFFGKWRKRVKALAPVVRESDGKWVISAEGAKVCCEVNGESFGLRFLDGDGHVISEDIYGAGYFKDGNLRRRHRACISEGDRFYGFGEKTGGLDKMGDCLRMYPSDSLGYDPAHTDPLYKHIPFFIKFNENTGVFSGMFYHNMSPCEFDMGRRICNYYPRHYTYTCDAGKLDYFVMAGPGVSEVIENYTYLTGRQPLFPRYAYGYLGSSMYYSELPEKSDEAILTFVDRADKEGVPMTGFMLSSGYTTQEDNKRCVFTWNKERFSDPADFVKKMRRRGVRICANVKPGFLMVHPLLDELRDRGFFIKDESGTVPQEGSWWGGTGYFADLTSEKNREIWSELLTKNVLDYGIDSVWDDNCEVDSIINDDALVDAEGHSERLAGYRAVTANIMCKIAYEALLKKDGHRRPFVVCRAGSSGIQSFASTWAGDNMTSWESLQYNIGTILGMGLSGVANQGCDVGGFHGPLPDPELFVRWVQMGIFMPRFSVHSCNTDNTVTEPWMYESVKDDIREAIALRYRLIGYIYSLMEQASCTGAPVLRPLFYHYGADKKVYDEAIQFLMGDGLMVAPVVTQAAEGIEVYFPEGGSYIDLKTFIRYEGGTYNVIPVTVSDIPMFLCSGGVVPLAAEVPLLEGATKSIGFTESVGGEDAFEPERLMVYVYPGAVSCGPDVDSSGSGEAADVVSSVHTYYEDDGVSMDYENGVYLKSIMEVSGDAKTELRISVSRSGGYKPVTDSLLYTVFCEDKAPLNVGVDGESIDQLLYALDFDKAVSAKKRAWYYDMEKKAVLISLERPAGDYGLDISFEVHDLIGM